MFLAFSPFTIFATVEEKASTYCYPVGELGAKWQFPSDHLPVGGTIGNIHFVIWNILDTRYLHHIVGNSQGLRDSLIMQANVPVDAESLLTVREALILENIKEMINHKTSPRALLALEETSDNVYTKMQESLPAKMRLIPESLEDLGHGDIFIYDTDIFEFLNFQSENYVIHPSNSYSTLTLIEKKTGLTYRFIQSHVPGGPIFSAPAREEFANTLMRISIQRPSLSSWVT